MSAAMGAVILLLLLGTQILEWHWLVLLPAATLAVGVWRTVRRLPSRYSIAQIIDARLGLSDTLSTAWYFAEPAQASCASAPIREAQRARANELSRTVDARQAIPFTLPRGVYSLAVLAVAATSLFALRYGLERRLDLGRPLARVIRQALGLEEQQLAALEKKKKDPPARQPDISQLEGFSINGEEMPGQLEAGEASSLDNANAPPSAERNTPRPGGKDMQGLSLDEDSGEGDGEGTDASEGDGGEPGQEGASLSGKPGEKTADDSGSNSGNNSSLLAKFRDAMQNLLSRMRQQPAGAAGQQQTAQGKNGRQGQKGANQNGGQGSQQGAGQETSQEGESGEDSQMAQNASGRGKSEGADEQSSRQPGSGIGKQDGDKDVKLAEQLAAMGKISEIIGKRSANVSGEVTMEVQSNNQQLQTPYSRRSATHGEAAADIGRDEVPMALQSYVQQYFEQVRKAK